jgi:hypothetical protein
LWEILKQELKKEKYNEDGKSRQNNNFRSCKNRKRGKDKLGIDIIKIIL